MHRGQGGWLGPQPATPASPQPPAPELCAPPPTRMHTLAAEHDVLRFEVPVDDALGVEVAQGQRDL